jgi:hypothetical protein
MNPLANLIVEYERIIEDAAARYLRNYHDQLFRLRTEAAFVDLKVKRFTLWIQKADERNREGIEGQLSRAEVDGIFQESATLGYVPSPDLAPPDSARIKIIASVMKGAIDPRVRFYQSLLLTPGEFEIWPDLIRARFTTPDSFLGSLGEIVRAEGVLANVYRESAGAAQNALLRRYRSMYDDFFDGRQYGRKHAAGICWPMYYADENGEGEVPLSRFD